MADSGGLDVNNHKWVLGDLDVELRNGWRVGASLAVGRNGMEKHRSETAGALYAKGFLDKKRRLELWTEAVALNRGHFSEILDVWAQIQWEFVNKYRLCLRTETVDNDEKNGNALRHDRNVVNINHKPNADMIISLEYVWDDFESAKLTDYGTVLFRVGTMFGGL